MKKIFRTNFTTALCTGALLAISFITPQPVGAETFKWTEAAKEVDTLPYARSYVDSLFKAFNVTIPEKPLRTCPESEFFKNETVVFDIGWGIFKAGYVVISSEYDPAHQTLRISGKALSNKFVGAFYRMRDYIASTIDARGLYPLFFEQHLREGKKYKSNGWILYDQTNKKLYAKERSVKAFDEVPSLINDYLSVLYVVRAMHFAPGDTFRLPLFADKKIRSIYFLCRERKPLKLDNGTTVSCLVMEPKLVADDGAFNKKDKMEVWLSDDALKIPLIIKSKINVGSITAKLIWSTATPGKPPIPAPVKPDHPAADNAKTTGGDSTPAGAAPVEKGTDSGRVPAAH
jgi:hypothetical protein